MQILETQYCFIAFLAFWGISSVSGSFVVDGVSMAEIPLPPPQLLQVNDSREDGISYEVSQAKVRLHVKETYPGKRLEDFSSPGTQKLKLEYDGTLGATKSNQFLEFLENLEVSKDSTWDIEVAGHNGASWWNQTLFSNVLQKLPSITSLSWTLQDLMPLDIIQFLEENHPFCRLHYEVQFWSSSEARQVRELWSIKPKKLRLEAKQSLQQKKIMARESILNSTILHSLKVEIINGGREPSPWKMDLIHRILTTCPNIKELDISVHRSGGCVVYPNVDPYGFDFTTSDAMLSPLESLTVDGYRFNGKPNGQNWMEWEADHPQLNILNLPWKYLPQTIIDNVGYPIIKSLGGLESSFVKRGTSPLKPGTKTNFDIWLERMDWTHLQTFKVSDPDAENLKKLEGEKLPALKNIAFSGYYADHHAILRFLSNTSSPLDSIDLYGINFCSLDEAVNTIRNHHGSTLHTLKIRHAIQRPKSYGNDYPSKKKAYRYPTRSFLNTTQLTFLHHACPKLVTLDIDIQIPDQWNYELFDTLVSFEELEYLTLRFEVEGVATGVHQDVSNYYFDDMGDEIDDEMHDLSGEERKALMIGVATYLRRKKVGKAFQQLETYVGWEKVGNTID